MKKKNDNIIEFQKRNNKGLISESEINSLFLGLVKLIYKSAEQKVSHKLKSECAFATKNFEQVQNQNKKLVFEIEKLKQINQQLNKRIAKQKV